MRPPCAGACRTNCSSAFEAQRQAERERAAAAQRQRLLQDLHDGLGSRLLALRVQADRLEPAALSAALDECLLEMRLSVDSLSETSGDLGVLLGRWRQRAEPVLQAAGLRLHWRVFEAPELDCLRDGGALELVRWLQEATSNVLRHAGARELTLGTETCEGAICLWLVDDGGGLRADAVPGQGLNSLRARAERLGATLDFLSPAPRDWVEDGVGTALRLRLPTGATPSAGPR
jgi:signal transduction histidine kinase